ncbi:MAG: glycosyltransferase family 4 protein [Candidatus Auribacterota bacterium]|nr:glycosyltransferase family 4 protein [Candidatus Auribacterota bacterium]
MKILQVAYKSTISGGEKVLFDLATSLKERGHEVSAVCPDPGQLPDELRKAGIESTIIPFHKTYDIRAARRLARLIGDENIEVLHSHSMLTNIVSRVAGRLARVPVSVSTEHLTMELGRGGRSGEITVRLKARYYRLLDNYTSRYNQQVIAVSNAVRDDLVEQGIPASRITVIQNGINIPDINTAARDRIRLELGIKPEETVIGAVGRLSPQKDYPTLLHAFKRVNKSCPEAVLLIAGDGYLRDNLEELTDDLGIRERVKFLGYRSDVMEVFSSCDIYTLSSLWEGLPLAVLEAMAMGKPVVATAVPGTEEAVNEGETGFLVPLKDDKLLGQRLIDLARNPEKAQIMGEAGRRRWKDCFSLNRVIDEHEDLYKNFEKRKR